MTNDIESAIIIYRKGQQRAEPKVLKGGYTMNEMITKAFDEYTEKYKQARQYGDILRRVDEEIDGLGSVTIVTIATELDTNIYTLINGRCVSVKRA